MGKSKTEFIWKETRLVCQQTPLVVAALNRSRPILDGKRIVIVSSTQMHPVEGVVDRLLI